MGLNKRLQDLYHYKLRTVIDLISRGELGYLFGVLSEKAAGRNVYVEYMRQYGRSLTAERNVQGHTMTLDLTDPGLSRYLISRGVNEPNATPAFLEALHEAVDKHPRDDLAVLDVGANLGYFALLEANVLGDRGTIYAFEPAPSNVELLEDNVEQNDYQDRIEIQPTAIGDRDGTERLLLSDHSNWHRISTEPVSNDAESIPVDCRRVDSVLGEEQIDPETVVGVRMDVEGYESAIFEGMTPILEADSPAVLFVELHPSELTDAETERLLSQLSDGGFSVAFAGQDRQTFDVDEPENVASIDGSHVRLVLTRS